MWKERIRFMPKRVIDPYYRIVRVATEIMLQCGNQLQEKLRRHCEPVDTAIDIPGARAFGTYMSALCAGGELMNWEFSVEPSSASVSDLPPATIICTASK